MPDDEIHHECGVFGIWAPSRSVPHLIFDGLFALQHRGPESAGMAVSDGSSLMVIKDMGLVTQVFNKNNLRSLSGRVGIGHTRYSTTGSSAWENAQPRFGGSDGTQFAMAHNGNITNTAALAHELGRSSRDFGSDSNLVAELLSLEIQRREGAAGDGSDHFVDAIAAVAPRLEGAYSIVLMDHSKLVALRDPNGFHPLCLGRLGDDEWVFASETAALHTVGAEYVREIEPGEMAVVDEGRLAVSAPYPPERVKPAECFFERVYFARPDSWLDGRENFQVRYQLGEALAAFAPPPVSAGDSETIVIGIPDSGVPAAEGYAHATGLTFSTGGLIKNRYIGRTFMSPDPADRARAVERKLNAIASVVNSKRVIVVDDTIVRGNTPRGAVRMLREAGAKEVHFRVSAPPYVNPCYYGIDVGSTSELLAAEFTVEEMAGELGVDSLHYLPMEQVRAVIGKDKGLCDACITGNYPVPVTIGSSGTPTAVST